MDYLGSQPADHKTADAASSAWSTTIKGEVAPERMGLAKAALFALFRLSGEERRAVFAVFCETCGDHCRYCEPCQVGE